MEEKDTSRALDAACDVDASGVIVRLSSSPRQVSIEGHFIKINRRIDAMLIQAETNNKLQSQRRRGKNAHLE